MPPIQRTPPQDSSTSRLNTSPSPTLQHGGSEPNLLTAKSSSITNVTKRNINKRLRRGSSEETPNDALMAMISTQSTKLETIMNFMTGIKEQIGEIQASVDFMSCRYDELLIRFDRLEEERKTDQKYIKQLENKIESLERGGRMSCVEIMNIPYSKGETKHDLFNIVSRTCSAVNNEVEKGEIRNIYRVNTNNQEFKPIITEFVSVLRKNELITAVKNFNKSNKNNKLNTSHISIKGTPKPIYISESLSYKNKKLYAMAREYAKAHNYQYCWTSQGTVFLRKAEGSPANRILEENDLVNLHI